VRHNQPVPGYFNDASLIRRVHREQVLRLSGARALLMQAAHPVAFAGFFMSTGSLEDPYARLYRTARVLDTIVFGEREAADRVTAAVRRVHSRTRGTLPYPAGKFAAGTPWAADDPALMLWILATLADSGALVYERYVGPLSERQRDAYWRDWRTVGRLFGLAGTDMPEGYAGLREYMRTMLAGDVLHVSSEARQLGIDVVLRPPVPARARPLLEAANFTVVGLLPARIRRGYGLGWDPLRSVMLRVTAESARRTLVPALPRRLRFRGSEPLAAPPPSFGRPALRAS
jgi:uncharacterized protein (DUF2236 family)